MRSTLPKTSLHAKNCSERQPEEDTCWRRLRWLLLKGWPIWFKGVLFRTAPAVPYGVIHPQWWIDRSVSDDENGSSAGSIPYLQQEVAYQAMQSIIVRFGLADWLTQLKDHKEGSLIQLHLIKSYIVPSWANYLAVKIGSLQKNWKLPHSRRPRRLKKDPSSEQPKTVSLCDLISSHYFPHWLCLFGFSLSVAFVCTLHSGFVCSAEWESKVHFWKVNQFTLQNCS